MYGISVDDIKNANNLTSNILTIGQVLTIPTDEVSSNTSNLYVVQKEIVFGVLQIDLGLV